MTSLSATTKADQNTNDLVSGFTRTFSIEVTPGGARKIDDFRNHLAEGTWVYVTSLPGRDFSEVVETCKKLANEGMVPVPHITARGIANAQELDERLDRVTSTAGVTRVLAIAGGDGETVGEFPDTISLLQTGHFEKYQIRSIGVAGHPEGVPGMERALIRHHNERKIEYARSSNTEMYIVTQFVFDAQPVFDFAERIRAAGNHLPIIVGLPGLATLQSLLRYAMACGVGPSMQFLSKRAKDLRKLLTVQTPDKLVLDIARYVAAHPDCGISGMHLFPLGGFEKSAAWANAVAAGEIEMQPNGFNITGEAPASS